MRDATRVILHRLHEGMHTVSNQAPFNRLQPIWRWLFQHQAVLRILISGLLVGLLSVAFLTIWVPTVTGKSPITQVWQQQLQHANRAVERRGTIETIPVWFDGEELFTIASPTVWDRSKPGEQLPVEIRAEQVEANLNRVIEGGFLSGSKDGILTNFDPKTFQVNVAWLNDVPILTAVDSMHSQPLKLVTVTYLDADYNGQPTAVLAERWRSILYQHLYTALMNRSPQALGLRGALGESLMVLGLTLVVSGLLWFLQVPLRWENQRLRTQQADLMAHDPTERAVGESALPARMADLKALQQQFLAQFEQHRLLQYRRNSIGFLRWLLAWAQVAVWMAGVIAALLIFPWTKPYGGWLLGIPTGLLSIWFFTSGLNRLTGALLHGAAESWVQFSSSQVYPQRDARRIFTLFSALKPAKTFSIYALGAVVTLVYLGLPLTLVLAVAGVLGLAMLLIGQNFVCDWLMGSLILWEDQYVIGDVIATNGRAGLVERLNLRCTQLRHPSGKLISLANGTIHQVENLSRHESVKRVAASSEAVRTPPPVQTSESTEAALSGSAPLSEGPLQS